MGLWNYQIADMVEVAAKITRSSSIFLIRVWFDVQSICTIPDHVFQEFNLESKELHSSTSSKS